VACACSEKIEAHLSGFRAIYEQVRRNYVFLAPFDLKETKIGA
jgi:hypothetical protein